MPSLDASYSWAINTCNAPNVGYSQAYRNQQTVDGVTYYDCSSFMWYALQAGGFDVLTAYRTAVGEEYSGNAITTSTERAFLLALGFVEVPINGTWSAGDILWRSGHTEMVYKGGNASGITMGAHTANTTLANQVSINNHTSSSSSWSRLYRFGNTPAEKKGISMEVVAAICGNWMAESTINPGIYENLRVVPLTDDNVTGGYGLGQWTNNPNTGITRRTQLANWLDLNGYAMDSGEGQLEFMLYENVWYKEVGSASREYDTLNDFLHSTSDYIERLANAFYQGWEGLSDPDEQMIRGEYALKVYEWLESHGNDTGLTWTAGNRWLNVVESYNNATLIYQYLNVMSGGGGGGGGGGGTPTYRAKGMPVWMMLRYY